MKKIFAFLATLTAISTLQFAEAGTIAVWTFESSSLGTFRPPGVWLTNITAEVGTGTASAWHSVSAVYSSFPGNGSPRAFGVTNGWAVGDFFQFVVSTVGNQNISISYDQAGTSAGPGTFFLAYSTDGNSFTKIGSDYSVNVGNWNSLTTNSSSLFNFNLSAITSINNKPAVYFRVVNDSTLAINGGTLNGFNYEGDRIDNFMVTAQPVPEPATTTLFVAGACGMLLGARRRAIKR